MWSTVCTWGGGRSSGGRGTLAAVAAAAAAASVAVLVVGVGWRGWGRGDVVVEVAVEMAVEEAVEVAEPMLWGCVGVVVGCERVCACVCGRGGVRWWGCVARPRGEFATQGVGCLGMNVEPGGRSTR